MTSIDTDWSIERQQAIEHSQLADVDLQIALGMVASTGFELLRDLLPLARDHHEVGPQFPLISEEIWSGTVGGGRGDRLGSAVTARLDGGHSLKIEHNTFRFNKDSNFKTRYPLIVTRWDRESAVSIKARNENRMTAYDPTTYSSLTIMPGVDSATLDRYVSLVNEDLEVLKDFRPRKR